MSSLAYLVGNPLFGPPLRRLHYGHEIGEVRNEANVERDEEESQEEETRHDEELDPDQRIVSKSGLPFFTRVASPVTDLENSDSS